MKTQFDWQTEVESRLQPDGPAEDAPASRRRYGRLMLMLTASILACSLLVWQFNVRQAQLLATVREDVIRAFELQQQAAGRGDRELFSALLSSADRSWKRDQERLLAAGLFNNRDQVGIAADAASRRVAEVELGPDLHSAELFFVQNYISSSGATAGAAIELRHALLYRLENGRWLNAPPDAQYWGPSQEVQEKLFSLTFPARDADLALPLAQEIAAHLERLCSKVEKENAYGAAFCGGKIPWRINLAPQTGTLLRSAQALPTHAAEYNFELPSPSVLGVPVDGEEQDLYLEIYVAPLLRQMEAALLPEAPFPDQQIYALCFDFPPRGRRLYRYDWRIRSWQPVVPQQTFEHLSALPDDSAVMLANENVLTFLDAGRGSNPDEIRRTALPDLDAYSLVGWTTAAGHPYYLLQDAPEAGAQPGYSALDPRQCQEGACRPTALAGYPLTSAVGDKALYAVGSEISLGPWLGEATESVGRAFSPFWLDADTYGIVRFVDGAGPGLTTQVLLADIAGGEEELLFDGTDLAREAHALSGGALFVNDVVPNSAIPGQLLVSASGIRAYAGQYFIFTVDVSAHGSGAARPAINLQLVRSGSQGGVPGLLRPTGPLPFLLSNDGRWLAMTELRGRDRDTWAVLVHDLQTGTTKEVSTDVPAMPANFPLLDWSGDGRWLLVADRDFLLLYAPEPERREIVAHGFDACTQIVWAG